MSRDEARHVIDALVAAGCSPKLSTGEGWVDTRRPVEAVESAVLTYSVAEYERVTPTGLRLVRSWPFYDACDPEHVRVAEIVAR